MNPTIIKAEGRLEEALNDVARQIFSVCASKRGDEPAVIGLCGGRSVVGLLSALRRESVNLPGEVMQRLHFFMVDERLVPLTHEQSNYGGLQRLLFDSLVQQGVISEGQLHPFRPAMSTKDFGCLAYREELERFGGRFTVVVVGVGEDGHIAGLFPGHAALQETDSTFIHFHDSPKPPADRMTASAPLITSAELSVVLALGEGKRAAWQAFKDKNTAENLCPAKLALRAKQSVVVTDLE